MAPANDAGLEFNLSHTRGLVACAVAWNRIVGVDVEPLAEGLYRGLMRCHSKQGRASDALRAYRRCREMLSILLGIKPSAATETLLREIHG